MSANAMDEIVAVSLRQGNTKIECKVTWQDDNAAEYDLRASSMHRAKREITASLGKEGLLPVDRWSAVESDGGSHAPFQSARRGRQMELPDRPLMMTLRS